MVTPRPASDYSDFENRRSGVHASRRRRVAAMEDTGAERYDIPAFLRKQAD